MCIVLDKLTLVVLCVLRSSSKGENKYKLYYGPCSEQTIRRVSLFSNITIIVYLSSVDCSVDAPTKLSNARRVIIYGI